MSVTQQLHAGGFSVYTSPQIAVHPKLKVIPLFATAIALLSVSATAQTDCNRGAGRLSPSPPEHVAIADIISQFGAKESAFQAERRKYTFTQDVLVQTLRQTMPHHFVPDGEFRQVMDISFDHKGKRIERVTFAPVPTLRLLTLTHEDWYDIRELTNFMLTSEVLPLYDIRYAGQQQVDELETYVFDVAPKIVKDKNHYFQGRVWVEAQEFAVVKMCGKTVPNIIISMKKGKRVEEDIHPNFATYREHIDGSWFPTYSRSDEIFDLGLEEIRLREVIKFLDYRPNGLPKSQSLAPNLR